VTLDSYFYQCKQLKTLQQMKQ